MVRYAELANHIGWYNAALWRVKGRRAKHPKLVA